MDFAVFESLLFLVSLVIGFVASLSGVGGGVLFTPLVLAFSNLDVDIVRAAGIALAMTTSAFTGRRYIPLLKIEIIIFVAAFMSLGTVAGAYVGISLVRSFGALGEAVVRISLGLLLFFVVFVMIRVKLKEAYGSSRSVWGDRLGLVFEYVEEERGEVRRFVPRRLDLSALALFAVGFIGGAYGLGGGWALVPVLNLVMGLPLRLAVMASGSSFALGNASGFWIYIHSGAAHPTIIAPTALGVAVGSIYGSKIATRLKTKTIRTVVILVMIISAIQLILRGVSTLLK